MITNFIVESDHWGLIIFLPCLENIMAPEKVEMNHPWLRAAIDLLSDYVAARIMSLWA